MSNEADTLFGRIWDQTIAGKLRWRKVAMGYGFIATAGESTLIIDENALRLSIGYRENCAVTLGENDLTQLYKRIASIVDVAPPSDISIAIAELEKL